MYWKLWFAIIYVDEPMIDTEYFEVKRREKSTQR